MYMSVIPWLFVANALSAISHYGPATKSFNCGLLEFLHVYLPWWNYEEMLPLPQPFRPEPHKVEHGSILNAAHSFDLWGRAQRHTVSPLVSSSGFISSSHPSPFVSCFIVTCVTLCRSSLFKLCSSYFLHFHTSTRDAVIAIWSLYFIPFQVFLHLSTNKPLLIMLHFLGRPFSHNCKNIIFVVIAAIM